MRYLYYIVKKAERDRRENRHRFWRRWERREDGGHRRAMWVWVCSSVTVPNSLSYQIQYIAHVHTNVQDAKHKSHASLLNVTHILTFLSALQNTHTYDVRTCIECFFTNWTKHSETHSTTANQLSINDHTRLPPHRWWTTLCSGLSCPMPTWGSASRAASYGLLPLTS